MSNDKHPAAGGSQSRSKVIVRTSIIGIITNILLSGFKATVGLISNSIAILLDAVNNLSDALSSLITIIGAKIATRTPDKKHPLGHGRVEYLSALIVSAIVLYAGITAAIESVKKIITPEKADYSIITLVIMGVAIIAKIAIGLYFKAQGKKVNSTALVASGTDATFDAIVTTSVLVTAVIYMITGVSLEAYMGVIISVFILKSGFGLMTETLDDILGHRADADLTKEIKRLIGEEPEVRGAYDLILNNYGPDKNYASVHIELPDTMNVEEVDRLTRRIESKIYQQTGVILTGVGVYSHNTKNDEAAEIRNRVQELVLSHEWALQLHGFYVDIEQKKMRFDVVMSFNVDSHDCVKLLCEEIKTIYPGYSVFIAPDVDVSD